ncbi:MAG: isoleucine--tRNA ligase [Bacteroidales bacterium]|nr:isoleucine--tRNA ligase [Bacteroidales bacterium]
MSKQFAEVSQLNLSKVNEDVLKQWDEKNLFHKSMTEREGCPSFVFYEGPPSANGMPGIHHVMARTIKDTFCRYKTMKGFQVKRKAGWDTHGLPVELSVEKTLGITKENIGKTISVEEYNRHCREEVMKYTKEWTDLTHKMGYWVDLDNPYITYDNRYIETLWWLLKNLYDQDLLYKGYTIQPYSPAAGTGLSSHELNQPGCYRDVKDTTVTALFRMKNPAPELTQHGDVYFAAWTTTPWTLPANSALCVGPNIKYVAVQCKNNYTGNPITVIMAQERLSSYFKKDDECVIVSEFHGYDLLGWEYDQLFPWINPGKGAFRIISGDYVTTEDGTGIVHIAASFGADDLYVAKAAGVPTITVVNKKGEKRPIVDSTGKYTLIADMDQKFVKKYLNVNLYRQYEGRYVKNAYDPRFNQGGKYDEVAAQKSEDLNIALCMELKQSGKALRIEKHVHNYPHCWRTDKPILYYPLDSWFIRSTARKHEMMKLNKSINWKPANIGTGRFGKWLENLNDWNLSRSRYWGTPLPIWRNDNGDEVCIGSVEELYNEIEKSVKAGFMKQNPYKEAGFVPGDYSKENYDKIDLHRPYVDDIILCSPSGKPMKRETDLIDVWFDSGAMPFAQMHYPFENKQLVDENLVYPADFIAEGVDQTRGWFFTLHAISSMVKDNVAYKNVISNGLVLDKNGMKMSKRLGNAVNPFEVIEKYGSDPLRWYMITNASPWDNLKFDVDGVVEVSRKFFSTLHNTYKFFAPYANLDGFNYQEAGIPVKDRPEIDRWILSELNSLIKKVDESLADYEPTRAGRFIQDFVNDNLSNWYVRLCRKRFWGTGYTRDKLAAYQTLYVCLETIAKLMAPVAPFYADQLYLNLVQATGRDNATSVHLAKFPVADESVIDKELENRMELAQKISSMGLALRKKVNIIVKQPLQKLMIPADETQKAALETVKSLIMNEVNVKEIDFVEGTSNLLVKKVKCNFKILGKKFGPLMKQVAAAVANMTQEQIATLEREGSLTFDLGGIPAVVESSEVEIFSEDIPGWVVANDGTITVALDIHISNELREEGIARELVSRIQNIRKSSGFEITDKINITVSSNDKSDGAITRFNDYIRNQVLANSLTIAPQIEGTQLEFDEFTITADIQKI